MTIKNLNGLSILVIDDEIVWGRLLERTFENAGCSVRIAVTCAEGIKLAELHKPDCILLDFHLTDGDAVSICLAIRSAKSIRKTPVIIFSGDPDAEIPAYTQCRAAGFILKGSISMEKFPETVAKILHNVPVIAD